MNGIQCKKSLSDHKAMQAVVHLNEGDSTDGMQSPA